MRHRYDFTPAEDMYLMEHYPTCVDNEGICRSMAEELGTPLRIYKTIHYRCKRIGAVRPPEVIHEAQRNSRAKAIRTMKDHHKRAVMMRELGIWTDYKLAMFGKYERNVRCVLRYRYGYRTRRKDHTIYYDSDTDRQPSSEKFYQTRGFTFQPLPQQ